MTIDVPEGWSLQPLKSTCDGGVFIDGDWIESKDQDPSGDIRLIQLADIGDGLFLDKSSRFMNDEAAERLKCTSLKKGDLLIARMPDPIGRTCIFPKDGKYVTVVDVCIVRPLENNTNPTWLMNAINAKAFRANISSKATGTTRKRISRKNLGKLDLKVPPLPEQKKIAEVLSSVDEAIAATKAVIDQTKQVKKGLLQTLLTKGIGHTKFKQTELGEIPESWEVVKLGDVALGKNGLQTGPFGSQLKAAEYIDEGIPVVMPKDLINRRISLSNVAQTSEEKAATLNKHRLVEGDILFGRRGDIGRCGLVTKNDEGFLCGTGCLRARLNTQMILPEFLISYLSLSDAISWLNENAVGQTMLNLNTSILFALPIPLPSIGEQKYIADTIDASDEQVSSNEQKLAQLQTLKSGLMSDLLTGSKRVEV